MLPEIHKKTILGWWDRYKEEDGFHCYTEDVGTLLYLGVEPKDIKVDDWWGNDFKQDCVKDIFLGTICPKYIGFIEGQFGGNIPNEGTLVMWRKMFKEGKLEFDPDKLVLEYSRYEVFFCTGVEKTLIMRRSNDGPDYTSGRPAVLRRVLEYLKKEYPNGENTLIYERALDIFDISNIKEVYPEDMRISV